MNINIKCPHCGTVSLVNCVSGMEQKSLACPKCQVVSKVGDYLPKLSLRTGDTTHQLHFGKQWVGRESKSNDAEIQMPDATRYMSRHHALIEVTCSAQGLLTTIEEHGKNPTELQGVELTEGDIIYLNVNDCVKMGDRRMYLANEYE